MPPQKFILALQSAAYAFTAWRLFARGLAARQSGLFVFLIFRCLLMLASTLVPGKSHLYFYFYVFFTPLDAVISVVAVREAIGLVLADYPGLRSIGRWTMYGAVVVAIVSSLLIAAAFWRTDIPSKVYYVMVANRSVVFALAVILISLLIFLSHYPLVLTINRKISTFAFGAIFLSEATALLLDSLAERLNVPLADSVADAFGAVCLVVWGAMLRAPQPALALKQPDTAEEERLLKQLDSLEQMARKLGQSRA
jgi:hypothetical protein